MKINKTGFYYFLFLCIYWPFVIFITVFLVSLGIAIIFYLQDGKFFFSWKKEAFYSVKYGLSGGLPLGAGIWFMSWMKARKDKQSLPKE
ncbi:hypothetical protein [Dryocola clanedunensis]|uniref:hypothetical protein n=1 Tax=Cedecea sulfonylureivorans TaxID=3051154 RepID=UPI0019277033|nr:hypothetical protein [Cedecea sulfonylureivorans]